MGGSAAAAAHRVIAPVLELRDVARAYARGRVRAVDGVSLALVPGEIVGLVGANGAGKTTLLRLAAGLLAPDSGVVTVLGGAPDGAVARRGVGYAPDGAVFPPALTVREVLGYYARLHSAGPRRNALVAEALALGELGPVADRRAAALSRGEAQRLALAQAAMGGRRVLLLDETLSGIDPVVRRALCDRLAGLAHQGVAVLLASHDLTAVERLAGRVAILVRGRIARSAPTAALLGERVLEIVLDRPPVAPPAGFRVTATGLERDLRGDSVEAALAVCRAHRLAVRASRVRLRTLEDVVLDTLAAR
ncbi:MAG TPA: ABC transporter ATP-binding protein [Gemmatimonadales bacterium]